jgi:hypothetical protein
MYYLFKNYLGDEENLDVDTIVSTYLYIDYLFFRSIRGKDDGNAKTSDSSRIKSRTQQVWSSLLIPLYLLICILTIIRLFG